MLLLVGLGNPGRKYDNNRHNIGFMAADSIARRQNFSIPRERFQAEICEGRLGSEKCLILKPRTYMNLSGQAVGEAMRYFKLSPADIIVFHDELDIPAGKVKFKTGGGHAGHNGLRSIDQHIGREYHRVRMGIGHPGDKDQVTGHVLGDFSKKDREWLDPLLDAVGDAAPQLAEGGAAFLNALGLILNPPRPKKKTEADKPENSNQ